MIAFTLGTLSVLAYIVAFIVGGDLATDICVFVYKKFYPVLFSFASLVVLFGLVKMYVAGEKSLTAKKKAKKEKKVQSDKDSPVEN